MNPANDIPAMKQAVENTLRKLADSDSPFGGPPVAGRGAEVQEAAPFPTPAIAPIARDGDTEYLLNGVIAEMHFIMRELAVPTAAETRDADMRRRYIASSIDLALAAAKVGKTVAGLRAAATPRALRQTTETLEVVGAAPENC
ncbi:MAG TPA: hypothetical protein VMF58_08585 [Rhizomicrobium sp.]|nr:hypothetical protein [Rhizomicrobium sp.]